MKSFLTTWMPILAQYRLPLLLAAAALVGVGIVMTQPTAPVSQWVEEDYVRSLIMLPPHTLAVTTGTITTLHPTLDATIHSTLPYTSTLYGIGNLRAQNLVAVSADAHWLVRATWASAAGSTSLVTGTILLRSLTTPVELTIPLALTNPDQLISCVVVTHDGQRLGWITNGDGLWYNAATVWDRTTQTPIVTRRYADLQGMVLSHMLIDEPEPRVLLSGNGVVEMRQLRDDRLQYRIALSPDERALSSCILSTDSSLMVGGGPDFLTIRRVADGQLLQRLPKHIPRMVWDTKTWSTTTAFSPDNRFILVASFVSGNRTLGLFPDWSPPADAPVELWDLAAGQIVQRFDVTPDGAQIVAYSPDGQYVATAGRTSTGAGEIRVFRVQPQLPYLQPLSLAFGVLLLALVVLPWLWLRR